MTDSRTVLTVVVFLGLLALIGLAGTIWLIHEGDDASLVIGVTGTALGALGSLLATTRSQADPAVQIVADQATAAGEARAEADLRAIAAADDHDERVVAVDV